MCTASIFTKAVFGKSFDLFAWARCRFNHMWQVQRPGTEKAFLVNPRSVSSRRSLRLRYSVYIPLEYFARLKSNRTWGNCLQPPFSSASFSSLSLSLSHPPLTPSLHVQKMQHCGPSFSRTQFGRQCLFSQINIQTYNCANFTLERCYVLPSKPSALVGFELWILCSY
jgi:hypothetical protein